MKNLIKFFTIIAFFSIAMISCGGADLKAINEKIEKDGFGASFTQKEYAAMADYVLSHYNEIDNGNDDKGGDYMMILLSADAEGKLDKSTQEKCAEISKKAKQSIDDFMNF